MGTRAIPKKALRRRPRGSCMHTPSRRGQNPNEHTNWSCGKVTVENTSDGTETLRVEWLTIGRGVEEAKK